MGQQILLCGRLLGRVCLFFICLYYRNTSMRAEGHTGRKATIDYQTEEDKVQQYLLVDCRREVSVSMLSMHELRRQEDLIFKQNTEIYNLLNQPPVPQLQGLTYAEINSSERLTHALMLLRSNAPVYQHMSQRKKTYFLKDLARRYYEKMKSQHCSKVEQAHLGDSSEGDSNKTSNQRSPNRKNQKSVKHKTIKKEQKKIENPLPNKKPLTLLIQSDCKYFSASSPPFSVQILPEYSFPTH